MRTWEERKFRQERVGTPCPFSCSPKLPCLLPCLSPLQEGSAPFQLLPKASLPISSPWGQSPMNPVRTQSSRPLQFHPKSDVYATLVHFQSFSAHLLPSFLVHYFSRKLWFKFDLPKLEPSLSFYNLLLSNFIYRTTMSLWTWLLFSSFSFFTG